MLCWITRQAPPSLLLTLAAALATPLSASAASIYFRDSGGVILPDQIQTNEGAPIGVFIFTSGLLADGLLDMGDGSPTLGLLPNGYSYQHTYADDGIFTVTYTGYYYLPVTEEVLNERGELVPQPGLQRVDDIRTATVTVINVDPIVEAITIEGRTGLEETFAVSARASDSGDDVLAYAWDLNNDGVYTDAFGQRVELSFVSTGLKSLSVRVTDDDGGFATFDTQVNVFDPSVVPLPSAMWGGAALLGGLLIKRRRA